MNFNKHPSHELVRLYQTRPYQGQAPEKADLIFLSSDANYSLEISHDLFFETILEYQKDGVAFWKRQGCHHPFLLPSYPFNRNQGGVPYHRNFSKLGLGPDYAENVSFIELLDVPTIGNRSEKRELFAELISLDHLKYIDNLIQGGGHKLFFVSGSVLRDMAAIKKSHSVFPWYDGKKLSEILFTTTINGNEVKEIYHFSSAQIHGQLKKIRADIDAWLNCG